MLPSSIQILILFSVLNFQITTPNHDIYISTLKIESTLNTSETNILIKVFADDFRDALQNHFPTEQFKVNDELCQKQEQITQYFSNYFNCEINQKEQAILFESCTLENTMYHISFKLKTPSKWSSIQIKANYLMELFGKQSNIIQLNYRDKKLFKRFVKNNESVFWEL